MQQETLVLERANNKPILLDATYVKNQNKKPILIFCHGYKGFKDWGCWNLMSKFLAEKNTFFIKFNFSHNGGTIEQPIDFPDLEAFGQNNFSKELDDLGDVISWITKGNHDFTEEINTDDITLIGHSRGGGIVTIKTSEDTRVKQLITLAGVSDYKARFPNGEILEHWKKEGVAYIENSRTKQQMPHYIQFYNDFIENEERLTISNAANHIKVPHLIIHGTGDETVPFVEAEHLHTWSKKSELFAIEDANHVFGGSHPWSKKQLPEDLRLVALEIQDFLKR